MKILIAYDGSECADAALEDRKSAGLPKNAEARVITLADVFLPPISEEIDNTFPMYVPAGVRRAQERAQRKLKKAELLANQGSEVVNKSFPGWTVSHERSEEHTSELQSQSNLVCRLLLEKKKREAE